MGRDLGMGYEGGLQGGEELVGILARGVESEKLVVIVRKLTLQREQLRRCDDHRDFHL